MGQSWDYEVDFVSVGSGLGGLAGVIMAHDQGCSTLVVEKSKKLGGVCAYSGGEVFVPCNHKMAHEGAADDPEAARAYLDFLAGGYADPALQTVLFETGPKAAKYMEENAGVRWKIVRDFPDYHHPHAPGTVGHGRYLEVELFNGADLGDWQKSSYNMSPHMPPGVTHDELFEWGSVSCILKWNFQLMAERMAADQRGFGPGMMGYFIKAAMVDRQIPALVGAPATKLIEENGVVIGLTAHRDGQELRIRAKKGVLLAMGGYDWHPDFPKYYEGLPEWNSMCQPNVEGDNLIFGAEVGACFAGVPSYNLGMFFGYQIPGEEHEGKPLFRASWEGGYPHAMWVNRAGRRFADESFYRDYLPQCHAWDGTKQEHPNHPPYLIFDTNYREKFAFGSYMPGQEIPEELVVQADSIHQLAEGLGLPPDRLYASVERFNHYAKLGEDPDFNRGAYPWAGMMIGDRTRKNPNLGPIEKPPYYGIRLVPVGAGVNAVGLKTNANGQVMHVRGRPIPGLYAAGNSAAALDTGAGYQSGLANLRGLVWGYLSGLHAARS